MLKPRRTIVKKELKKDPYIEFLASAKKNLDKVIKLEPDNILAWKLKGISHNRLGEFVLSDLAAAEENFQRRDYERAIFFQNV